MIGADARGGEARWNPRHSAGLSPYAAGRTDTPAPSTRCSKVDTGHRSARSVGAMPAELIGYGVLVIGLAVLLWSRIGDVDGFYLDEWIYVHGSQYIWENLPGQPRGRDPAVGPRSAALVHDAARSDAGDRCRRRPRTRLSHVLNVLLLVSAIVPTALLARSVIDAPALRVLAVALGTAVPWLMIGSHLLTENLAFPLYMWAVYATIRCAAEPSLGKQAAALAAIAALALCRLNLGFMIVGPLRSGDRRGGDAPAGATRRAAG